jgi:hypothetical protein
MRAVDPMAVAVDWLDAYRSGRINQIVSMHSPNAVIECACEGRKIIYGFEGITAYWRHRLLQTPALGVEDMRMDGATVAVAYRVRSGIVQALLDVASDGAITRCRCGPMESGPSLFVHDPNTTKGREA